MIAPSARLTGARYLNPLRQGDLSNLCGLYSVLNAVQLACWRVPPSQEQLRQILQFGFRFLTRRRMLARVVALGMDTEVWAELCTSLIDYSNKVLASSLALQALDPHVWVSGGSTLTSIKLALTEGHPVLCGLGGALEHYTVLAGYSTKRLTLFDSSGFRWVELRSLGVSEQCGKRHWLYPASATTLVGVW